MTGPNTQQLSAISICLMLHNINGLCSLWPEISSRRWCSRRCVIWDGRRSNEVSKLWRQIKAVFIQHALQWRLHLQAANTIRTGSTLLVVAHTCHTVKWLPTPAVTGQMVGWHRHMHRTSDEHLAQQQELYFTIVCAWLLNTFPAELRQLDNELIPYRRLIKTHLFQCEPGRHRVNCFNHTIHTVNNPLQQLQFYQQQQFLPLCETHSLTHLLLRLTSWGS